MGVLNTTSKLHSHDIDNRLKIRRLRRLQDHEAGTVVKVPLPVRTNLSLSNSNKKSTKVKVSKSQTYQVCSLSSESFLPSLHADNLNL